VDGVVRGIVFDRGLLRRVDQAADREHRSRSNMVREILERGLTASQPAARKAS